MSTPNYISKPDWPADGSKARKTYPGFFVYPSKHGWVAPAAGMGTTAIQSISSDGAGLVTVNSTAHGLVTGQSALITEVAASAVMAVASISGNGTTVSGTTTGSHNYSAGDTVVIQDIRGQVEYNGTYVLATAATNAFTITSKTQGTAVLTGTPVMIKESTLNGYYNSVTRITANQFTAAGGPTSQTGTITGTNAEFAKAFEVIWAVGELNSIYADAVVVPTYTASITYSNAAHVVTGDIVTVTLATSEPVSVQGSPKVVLNVNATTRNLVYDAATSTSTSLKFKYTAVAGDVATAGQVTTGAATVGGYVSDILPESKSQKSTVTFSAPDASGISFN